VLERPVLQQPGEQQVADLEQGQVLLVVDSPAGSNRAALRSSRVAATSRKAVVSSSSNPADLLGVGDELVGHLVQRHLGDVQAVREDQLQQQVERTLEVLSRT
jgi:hypothetical protein